MQEIIEYPPPTKKFKDFFCPMCSAPLEVLIDSLNDEPTYYECNYCSYYYTEVTKSAQS